MYTNGETIGEERTMAAIQGIFQKMPDVDLRDLFATSAMNTIINCHTNTNLNDILNVDSNNGYYLKTIPEAAYKLADAMLEARRKK